jgi:hypothetical protein
MKWISSFILIVFIDVRGWSQREVYKYEVKNKSYIFDSVYDCIESEFSFIRNFSSKNKFSDYSFYINGRDTTYRSIDSFAVVNHTWRLRRNSKWQYYFSVKGFNEKRKTPHCYLLDSSSYLSPFKKIMREGGDTLYSFQLRQEGIYDNLVYVFDPKIGFVSMETERCTIFINKQ